MRKKTLNSIFIVALISIFTFSGVIISAKAGRPYDFYIEGYIDWDHTTIEYTYNDRFGIYEVAMTWIITSSDLVEDFEEGNMTFNSVRYVHYIRGDIAVVRGDLGINLNDGTVVINGYIHATMTLFSDPDDVHTVGRFSGRGDVNIRGTTEALGISEELYLEGTAW